MFSNRLSPKLLSQWCRALRHGVDIGLPLGKIFRQQAKGGPPAGQVLAGQIAARLDDGESLRDAIKPDAGRFPVLFNELVALGERSGRLTETFVELEHHFDTVIDANRKFTSALVYPVMMYFAAVAVIALMLLVLGLLAPAGSTPFDPLGLGLLGPTGAAVWLAVAGGFTAAVVFGFLYVKSNDGLRARGEALALKVPGLAGCFRAFALHRFSIGLHMTSEAGLKVDKALALSFRATSNRAYTAHADAAARSARNGNKIAPTLTACGPGLFPDEYLDAVHVGEETGRLPEVMARQAKAYQEESTRKMKVLATIAGAVVYLGVALLVIVLIFRIALSISGVYSDAMKGL